jgi:hypothetical protein
VPKRLLGRRVHRFLWGRTQSHVYLVLKVLNSDEMVIADNQALTLILDTSVELVGKRRPSFF